MALLATGADVDPLATELPMPHRRQRLRVIAPLAWHKGPLAGLERRAQEVLWDKALEGACDLDKVGEHDQAQFWRELVYAKQNACRLADEQRSQSRRRREEARQAKRIREQGLCTEMQAWVWARTHARTRTEIDVMALALSICSMHNSCQDIVQIRRQQPSSLHHVQICGGHRSASLLRYTP